MEYDSVAKLRYGFYRLVGTDTDDPALTDRGESSDDVAYLYLTSGARAAQRWLLKQGYRGWRQRSSALSWSGADSTDGGRYASLPSDFLRAYGNFKVSCLREANGTPWGIMLTDEDDETRKGDYFYFRGDVLWLTYGAQPPTTVYLEYHYQHPAITSSLADNAIDFPMEARPLIVAEAANEAKEEDWLPYGVEVEQKIERALQRARLKATDIARPTKAPRRFRPVYRAANRW